MQLKMSHNFNMKVVQETMQAENKFLTEIFSRIPLPVRDLGGEIEESEDDESQQKKNNSFAKNGKAKRAQTFGELHEKLTLLKGVKKLTYGEKKEKKGLKNRLKKKTKREERLMMKKMVRTEQNAAGTKIKNEEVESVSKAHRAKPVFNSEGHMVFSKFDFSDIGTKKKIPKAEKDPKKALQILKEKKEKVKSLIDAGEKEKADEIVQKDAWKTVLAKASGEKVKDDVELLKKSIKRDEQKKKHSSKKWDSRSMGVEKAQQERQQKRTDNIMKRKKEKKTNKLKKASKKGRIIPGF